MVEESVKCPRVISRANIDHSETSVHSAIFCWNIRTLDRIVSEFGCDRSNEKATTIQRGCRKTSNIEIAKKLAGKMFLVDMEGREPPIMMGKFAQDTLSVIQDFVPDSMNEPFIEDLYGEARDATKFKLMMKSVIQYSRLLYVNEKDENLILMEVTTEPCGDGLVNAMFRAGSQDADLWCAITEATNFTLED